MEIILLLMLVHRAIDGVVFDQGGIADEHTIEKLTAAGLDIRKVLADNDAYHALKAIDGLAVASLSDKEKEHAAKAIEQGYLYREGDMLYTKILVHDGKDSYRLFAITRNLTSEVLTKEAEAIAEKLADLIRKNVPEYLYGEWSFANELASLPVHDALVESLIERGLLTPPENRLGAEGCWMSVEK